MRRAARWFFGLATLSIAAACAPALRVLPAPSGSLTPSPNAAFRAQAPAPLEGLRVWSPPQVATRTLQNGMHILVVERHDLPIVSVRYANRAAASLSDGDRPGLAVLVGDALLEGTIANGDEVVVGHRVAGVRPYVQTSAGGTSVQLDIVSSALAPAVETMAQIVRRPEFSQAGVNAAARQQSAFLYAANQSVDNLVMSLELNVLFGTEHPFVVGSKAIQRQLTQLTLADVRTYYNRTYGPAASALVVVGDATADRVFGLAERYFGDWKHQVAASATWPAPAPRVQHGTVHAIHNGGDLTRLTIVQPAVTIKDPQTHAFELLARVIRGGDSFGANSVLRHERGVTYGVWSAVNTLGAVGFLQLRSSVESSAVYESVEAIRNQLRRLREVPIDDAELSIAKRAYLSSFQFASTPWLANYLSWLDMQGLGPEWLAQVKAAVDAITADQLSRLARNYFAPDGTEIIAVGDLNKNGAGIKRIGKVIVYQVKTDR